MNLHEHQGKEILKHFGVAVPMGLVAETVDEAVKAAAKIAFETGADTFAVKAQIHAGGRGKGGGVKIARSPAAIRLRFISCFLFSSSNLLSSTVFFWFLSSCFSIKLRTDSAAPRL